MRVLIRTKNPTGSLNEPDGVVGYIATATSKRADSVLTGLKSSIGNKRESKFRAIVLPDIVNIPHNDILSMTVLYYYYNRD